jgi:two-component system chemotaxis response regulator CheB
MTAALGALGVELTGAVSTADGALARVARGDLDILFVEPEATEDIVAFVRRVVLTPRGPRCYVMIDDRDVGSRMTTELILAGASGTLVRPDTATADAPARFRSALGMSHPPPPGKGPPVRRSRPPHRRSKPPVATVPPPRIGNVALAMPMRRELVAIGCSTGGPPALTSLLAGLPARFATPIAVVQHMAAHHLPFFADALGRSLSRPVIPVTGRTLLEPGRVYLACADLHMVIARDGPQLNLGLLDAPEEHNCRPAVDPFFRSVAAVCGQAAVGVVLTGMGSDGAIGARAMADAGAPIFAQDAATSVVWGMPGAVHAIGAATAVLPLDQISKEILRWISG